MTNIEKLAEFIEKEGRDLLPAFLRAIEVSFEKQESCFEKSEIGVGNVTVFADQTRTA